MARWIKRESCGSESSLTPSLTFYRIRRIGIGWLWVIDLRRAALRRLLAAERSVDDGAGDTGSGRGKGEAHRGRSWLGKLNVWSKRQGAHGNGGDCSSETSSASGGSVRGRERRCGSSRSKTMMWLDAVGCGECGSVNEEARGAQVLPVGFAGNEADGGGGRSRRCRSP